MNTKKFCYTAIIIVLLLGIYFLIWPIIDNHNSNRLNNDKHFVENIFFTKWLGYNGYFLDEEIGRIDIPFIDCNKNRNFEDNICSVELLPSRGIVDVKDFSFIDGSSSDELDIKTIAIEIDLLDTGSTMIDQIKIYFKNDEYYIWDIGNIKIDILDNTIRNHLELGVRHVLLSHFTEFTFNLINITDGDITVKDLVFDLPDEIFVEGLIVADTLSNISDQYLIDDEYILNSKDSKVFSFKINATLEKQYRFYLFKPFLQYRYKEIEYLFPLDYIIYSGFFTDEVLDEIQKNGYIK